MRNLVNFATRRTTSLSKLSRLIYRKFAVRPSTVPDGWIESLPVTHGRLHDHVVRINYPESGNVDPSVSKIANVEFVD